MITKDNNYRVMELFFKSPTKGFHMREMARLTGLSSTGIIKIIKKLKKEKILISEKTRNVELVKPDFEGRFVLLKRLYNLCSLYDLKLVDFLREHFEMPKAIILFGSYADGTDNENSDIDIAVVTNKKAMPNFQPYEGKLQRKINLYAMDMAKTPNEFKNSLANGIVLDGFLEVLP